MNKALQARLEALEKRGLRMNHLNQSCEVFILKDGRYLSSDRDMSEEEFSRYSAEIPSRLILVELVKPDEE